MKIINRPNAKIRQQVARTRAREATEWIECNGYSTYLGELALIFGTNHHTLRMRMVSGWPLEAACLAGTNEGWTVRNVKALQSAPWIIPFFNTTLDKYFNPVVAPSRLPNKK